MNIFKREMRAHAKSIILWSMGMLFMIASGMGKFTSYTGSEQSMNDILGKMPKSLKAVLGFGDLDVTTATGFYGLLFVYLLIMAAIHAAMLGANILAKEERDRTAEFLMVKPVSRFSVVTAKLAAALVNVLVLNGVTLVLSIAIVNQYAKGEQINGDIAVLMAAMFIVQLLFLFTGSGIAAMGKNPRSSASIATAILLLTYIISVMVDMNNKLAFLKYITPFKYFDVRQTYEGGLKPLSVALSLAVIAVMAGVTYRFYGKRDLKV
ncbi:ABC-2 family transporter protein [Ruminiclostridium hungatei]|uniref:ABC-2 family transporter protein n=1 Tax=Ruminiclostridium hungatei TaxID=48256 RepID=A0A1V4SL24_RUMHU|nr:ABC transporter permease subunit [Ruminiclostridium hungatei]OPX43947.1 ABC-2 family transporter protein [Ruminiclostridium hungatei]